MQVVTLVTSERTLLKLPGTRLAVPSHAPCFPIHHTLWFRAKHAKYGLQFIHQIASLCRDEHIHSHACEWAPIGNGSGKLQ